MSVDFYLLYLFYICKGITKIAMTSLDFLFDACFFWLKVESLYHKYPWIRLLQDI